MRFDLRFCTNKSIKKYRDNSIITMHELHQNDAKITTFLPLKIYPFL